MKIYLFIFALIITASALFYDSGIAQDFENRTDAPPVGHTTPDSYIEVTNYHNGAGTIRYTEILNWKDFETNFLFLRCTIIPPKSGIGEHVHIKTEVMYINLDGPASFTLDGHTSVLPARSMVLCGLGSSHGIYNHTDREIRLISIAVSSERGVYDATPTGNSLASAQPETPPKFTWALFDRTLLPKGSGAHLGNGPIFSRRIWNNDSFKTNWFVTTQAVLPSGSSIGYHQHNTREEVYHVISGSGRLTANGYTFDVSAGDAVPCRLHGSHGIYNNSGEDLELLVFSVAAVKGVVQFEKNWGDDLTDK
ncbi:cupin domain-containing protein [Candidatus Latescibacterota bacterium]